MTELLLINPNTSAAITQRLAERAAALAPNPGRVLSRTAAFGAPYIRDELTYAVAAHAVLDALLRESVGDTPATAVSAVLIACFGDPGLHAARELGAMPVVGLAEASMRKAAALGPFAIVTGGHAWAPMLQRLAHGLGLAESLRAVHTFDADGAALATQSEIARECIAQACRALVDSGGVRSIVVGGAALAGHAAALQPQCPVPLIDSVDCGIRAAWKAAAGALPRPVTTIPSWWPS